MKLIRRSLTILFAIILFGTVCYGASVTTVSVDSSTAGVVVVSSINGGAVVTLPSNAAVAVWFAREEDTCSTTLIAVRGVRVTPGNGYEFLPKADQWYGQICGILESGSTAVTVSVNPW